MFIEFLLQTSRNEFWDDCRRWFGSISEKVLQKIKKFDQYDSPKWSLGLADFSSKKTMQFFLFNTRKNFSFSGRVVKRCISRFCSLGQVENVLGHTIKLSREFVSFFLQFCNSIFTQKATWSRWTVRQKQLRDFCPKSEKGQFLNSARIRCFS